MVGLQGGEEERHTLRLSEKRRPSCNDMSSLVEAAESWWGWEEAEDGDIATASITD